MFKDTQLNSSNLCTGVISNSDNKSLKKGFIETLNHDLKTPIIAQIRALELMLQGSFGRLNNEQFEMIQLTLESCNYMYEMVANLISNYKFDNEEIELNYSYFNIINLIDDNIKKMENDLKNSNIKIVIISTLHNPLIAADFIRIEKVVQTLLFNSVNAAFKNSIMKVYLKDKEGMLSVKIESHSGYISPDKIEKMFAIHTYNTDKFHKIGKGIGLYFVKKIIEKHEGKIIAESYIEQKNILGFELPRDVSEKIVYQDCG